jgi:hypothetical protein
LQCCLGAQAGAVLPHLYRARPAPHRRPREKPHSGPYNGGGPREILIPHNTDLPSGQRRTYEADQQMQALIDEYRSTHDGREPRVRTYGCSCTTILIILFAIMIIASIFGH